MTCEGRNREVRSSEETRAGRTVGWRVTGRQEKAEGAFEPNVPNSHTGKGGRPSFSEGKTGQGGSTAMQSPGLYDTSIPPVRSTAPRP